MTALLNLALNEIIRERERQNAKFGDQSKSEDSIWLTILTEEVGESAEAILDFRSGTDTREHLQEEVMQVAAVATAWWEALEKRRQACARIDMVGHH